MQWPCNDAAPDGTPIMHIDGFVRGKGNSSSPSMSPTDEKVGPRFPLLLTTGRILSQYNVGAQTRRTANVVWHAEDLLEIHPHDAEERGVKDGDWVRLRSRAGETTLRAGVTERVAPGVVYTTFHHPVTQANVVTTEYSDWATNCPEYKVTAVQVSPSNGPSEWQVEYHALSAEKPPDRGRARIAAADHAKRGPRPPCLTRRVSSGPRRLARRHALTDGTRASVPRETPVALTYNRSTHAVMLASPADLEDFAVGFSLSEGIIAHAADILALEIVEVPDGIECRMDLDADRLDALTRRQRRLAGPSGCGLCGLDSLAAAIRPAPAVPRRPRLHPGDDPGRDAGDAGGAGPEHRHPRGPCRRVLDPGARAGGAARGRRPPQRAGQALGRAARAGMPAADGLLLLSSRVSVEMVQKAATLGAPVIVAISAPTSLAIGPPTAPASR